MTHFPDHCPVCGQPHPAAYFQDKKRPYLSCPDCNLIFVPRAFHLTRAAEKAEYARHNNDPADPGYRRFLSRLCRPLLERLDPGQTGLDFGCGPGPALHRIMEEQGHAMALYDPLYADNETVLSGPYDFVTATEVAEHLHYPGRVFERLFGLLKPGGWLGIMTKMTTDKASFSHWHYIRDMTHVCFYSRTTFSYIARTHNASLTFVGPDVILMRKKNVKTFFLRTEPS